jgi:hypothetical protein
VSEGAHEAFVEHQVVDAPSDRKFGLTVGACFVAFACARWALGHGGLVTDVMAAAGATLVVVGASVPRLLGPLNRAWMRLGVVMASIVNPIVMLAMFALVFTPIALIMRLRGRDALGLRRKSADATYWHECEERANASERLRQQF